MDFVWWVRPSFKIGHLKFALVILWHTFVGGLNWRTCFIAHSQHFATFCWPVWLTLYLLERGGNGGHVLSSRDARICLYSQILNLRFFPAICSLCPLFSKFFNSYSFLSPSFAVLYATLYVHLCISFLCFVACLLNFCRHKKLGWVFFCCYSSFFVALISYFHCNSIGFFMLLLLFLAKCLHNFCLTTKERTRTTLKKGVYFVRPRTRVFQFSALQIEIQSVFAKQSRRNLTYAGHIISRRRLWLLGKVSSSLK